MPKIFVLIDYYLPGHKFGGPIQTVSNMVSRLSSQCEFFVFTFDRDEGDAVPYPGLRLDAWVRYGEARVYYTRDRTLRNILSRVNEIDPDLIYLNSFFSRATIRVLIGRKLGYFNFPLLLAPRGEFAEGALAIKSFRKKIYIVLVNASGLLKHVTLQASSHYEKEQIEEHLRWARSYPPVVAPNLADPGKFGLSPTDKKPGRLRAVFLSRISPNKNLDGALKLLHGLKGEVDFSICGPVGNAAYWSECEELIRHLPANIHAKHLGDVAHSCIGEVLGANHVLFLPSHGENFGHAIAESLAAGRPVVISDRTPWRDLESQGVGADIALDDPERFRVTLQSFIDMEETEFASRSRNAREYVLQKSSDPELVNQNLTLLRQAMRGPSR